MAQNPHAKTVASEIRVGVDIDAWHSEGSALLNQGRYDEAEAVFRRILAANATDAVAWCCLGMICEVRSQWSEAETAYRRALAADPRLPHAHSNLGGVLNRQGRYPEAEAACRQAILLAPTFVEAHNNLGVAMKALDRLSEAEALFEGVLAMRPDLPQAEANLAAVLRAERRMEEAGHHASRTIELGLDDPALYSDWLSSQQYLAGVTPPRLSALHAEWNRRYAAGLERIKPLRVIDRRPDRRLRVGFVSPDFRQHPVSYYLTPLLENLDPQACEVICFSDVRKEDGMTARLKCLVGTWRNVWQFPDEAVAQEIVNSRIDVLFDLAGHTAGNRLLVFARKPAPVQITWIGYPGTTGLRAMNYVLADRYTIPEGTEGHYCEQVLRMPHVYSCYSPPVNAPAVGPLPALKSGYVTFGSFNNPAKIGPHVIDVWAKILRRLPGARLLLRYGRFHQETGSRYLGRFAAHGVTLERVDLPGAEPCKNLLEEYRRVDIALDPFPYSGATTTCEALWMGVPVITCPGATFASRQSFSFLSAAGLADMVADNLDDYVGRAVALASDLMRLSELRRRLRDRVAASPLCDGTAFASDLSRLLRHVWAVRCQGSG